MRHNRRRRPRRALSLTAGPPLVSGEASSDGERAADLFRRPGEEPRRSFG